MSDQSLRKIVYEFIVDEMKGKSAEEKAAFFDQLDEATKAGSSEEDTQVSDAQLAAYFRASDDSTGYLSGDYYDKNV